MAIYVTAIYFHVNSCRNAVYGNVTGSFAFTLLIYSVRICVCVCVCNDFNHRLLYLCSTLYSNEEKHYARTVALVVTVEYQCMPQSDNSLATTITVVHTCRPINFINETKDRWVYCAAFGMLVNVFITVVLHVSSGTSSSLLTGN